MRHHNRLERRSNTIPDTETRMIGTHPLEAREAQGDKPGYTIYGYVARYESESTDLGGFTEILSRGAFKPALEGSPDVVALFNHDRNQVLGRTLAGTLRLREDDTGLYMECDLPATAYGRNLYESVKRGDIRGQSFTFVVDAKSVTWNKDFTLRRVGAIRLLRDVGPVTFPAYNSTDVASRSREEAMSQRPDGHITPPDGGDNLAGRTQGTTTMTIAERRKQAAELLAKADALNQKAKTESRDMTPDELAEVSRYMDESEQHNKQADAEQRLADLSARSAEPVARRSEPQTRVESRIEVIHGNSRHFTPSLFGTVEKAREAAYRAGRWALATLYKNEASREWCREHGVEMRAQQGSVNSKGGYLVPQEIETAIVNLAEEYGVARANCRNVRMGSDTKTVPVRVSGLKAYPVGELDAVPESEKVWGAAGLVARKWGVLVRYSSEVSEDAILSIADDLTQEAAVAFAEAEDDALFNGDGTNAYHSIEGIAQRLNAGSKKSTASGNTTLAKVEDGDITKVIGLLPTYAQRGAKIYCTAAVKGEVFDRLLRAAGGNTQAELAGDRLTRYAGLPVVVSPYVPATLSGKGVVAYIGDLNLSVAFGDRRVFTMKSSDSRFIESDESVLLATERFDINVFGTGDATKNGPLIQLSLV